MKVLRVYHCGRDAAHLERDRALVRHGVDLTLIVPRTWPGPDDSFTDLPIRVVELDVHRPGDINRHTYADPGAIARVVAEVSPDLVDIHEEPFSAVMHQVLSLLPRSQRVVGYTAQNIDKRFPPPFAGWERAALARLAGLYPCSSQAASVAVGKGFTGAVTVLPLAPPAAMQPGDQRPAPTPQLLLVGRMVPEKGVRDAVGLLTDERLAGARLRLVGEGPELEPCLALAQDLGVADRLEVSAWLDTASLARAYQQAHVVLAPSRSTPSWVEQFGRMVVEAQACGAVVVGYASGSIPEVVGDAGVVVAEGDQGALADAVADIVTDPEQWSRLRSRGLRAATDRTWDAVARGQIGLYEDALAGQTSRGRAQRAAARARWGEPALGGARPWALPRRVRALLEGVRR